MSDRRAARSVIVLFALVSGLLCGSATTLAESPPPKVTLKLTAAAAVRVKTTFTVHGTASAAASQGETVTVRFERKTSGWSVVSTKTAMLSAKRTFALKLKASSRGHWRILASLPASATHAAAGTSLPVKVVGKKVVALTFDDGPWPTTTSLIVSALRKNDAEGTFFEIGSQIGPRKKLAKSVIAGGNVIGVHSWSHAVMTRRSSAVNSADLRRCKRAVVAATGVTPKWFRPPYGSTSASLKRTASALGLRQVLWTVDTLDWKYRNTASIVSRALAGARNGSVVLMHDGGGPRKATAAAVPIVIRRLRAKGYDFVTLDELAALGYTVH